MTLIADSLRLRQETLAMAFVYTHKYRHHARSDKTMAELLDEYTLSLASLSLATKATESPRRLRELLLPAYALLNPSDPPLTFPSALYDALRGTVVTAELLLLRVLRFDIRLPLAYDYLPRMLEKVLTLDGTAHIDYLPDDEREEIRVVDVKDTRIGAAVWCLVSEAVRSYRLVILFPARTVAAACIFVAMQEAGLRIAMEGKTWVRKLTGDRVEFEDFEEAVEEVRTLREVREAR
ncbi:hypothetical protein FN846DRAFT_988137 [Sphaerosporella brunnea]|uniref:RNA polymerase II holoenzyme cyclin-like subunit n=1 Tax=Sphaerosporella brunnea TaxID=1250544 RepID=A0A5J5ES76_9PEZI|nr:hypothetical protein FN846DRAFT_988137 [Sphaerosporella brunnea]